MKKILIIMMLIFASGKIQAQLAPADIYKANDTLVAGAADSIKVDTLAGKYNKIYLTVTDTGATYTDSLIIEIYNKRLAAWSRVGLTRLLDNAVTTATNQSNTTAIYLVNTEYADIIRRRIFNQAGGYVANRRIISQLTLVYR